MPELVGHLRAGGDDISAKRRDKVSNKIRHGRSFRQEFRAALRDAIETMGRTNFAHGIMNWTKEDHWGYTNETGVIVKVVNGDWKVE